jgi:hypothetical protein
VGRSIPLAFENKLPTFGAGKLSHEEHRGQLTEIMEEISYRKKPKKNKGLCM